MIERDRDLKIIFFFNFQDSNLILFLIYFTGFSYFLMNKMIRSNSIIIVVVIIIIRY